MEADSGASASSNDPRILVKRCWALGPVRGGSQEVEVSSLGMGNERTGGLTMITNFSSPTIHEDGPGRGLRET